MRRREDYAIRRHTLNLYEGDYEALQAIHGTRVGAAKIIRDLVRAHLKEVSQKASRRLTESEDSPMSTELAQLFAKAAEDYDPEGHDLAAVVKAMRELRAQFELGLKAPAAERPKRAPKAPPDKGDLDLLKDLDL